MAYRNKTFVSFASEDIDYYRIMCAWRKNEHIEFDFHDAHDLNVALDTSRPDTIRAGAFASGSPTPSRSCSSSGTSRERWRRVRRDSSTTRLRSSTVSGCRSCSRTSTTLAASRPRGFLLGSNRNTRSRFRFARRPSGTRSTTSSRVTRRSARSKDYDSAFLQGPRLSAVGLVGRCLKTSEQAFDSGSGKRRFGPRIRDALRVPLAGGRARGAVLPRSVRLGLGRIPRPRGRRRPRRAIYGAPSGFDLAIVASDQREDRGPCRRRTRPARQCDRRRCRYVRHRFRRRHH